LYSVLPYKFNIRIVNINIFQASGIRAQASGIRFQFRKIPNLTLTQHPTLNTYNETKFTAKGSFITFAGQMCFK